MTMPASRSNLLGVALSLAVSGYPQTHGGCSEYPNSLEAMRDCYRPLLVFSPDSADIRLRQQQALLESSAAAMADRNVLYLPVLERAGKSASPLTLSAGEQAAARKRLRIAPEAFRVVLLGKDGGVKLSSASPVSMDTLSSLIDTMPMRKREVQQGHND